MKDYAIGIGIFFVLLFLLGDAALVRYRSASAQDVTLESAKSELATAMRDQKIKNAQLVQQFGNVDVHQFIARNKDTLKNMMEISSINQRIGIESEALRIPIQEQKTDSGSVAGKKGTALETVMLHKYSISILSSFKDSLLWLGKIEDAFPYARVESVKFSPSGEYVSLETRILFPRVDPAVIAQ